MTELVILPGLDGTGTLLDAFCGRLSDLGVAARTICYPTDQSIDYVALETFVRAQLPHSGQFVLLGESFSGPIAIQIAANPPTGLSGLILSTTFARAPIGIPRVLTSLIRFAPVRPPMSLLSWWLLGAHSTPTIRRHLSDALRAVRLEVLRARAIAALHADVSALLPAVRVPVLQLSAGQDRLLAPSTAKELASGLSSCRTVTVPGPHLLLQTAIAPCASEVAAFALSLHAGESSRRSS
jgi:pimeloyl-[acyl-carrier protein] methyl ester esterase